MATRRTARPTMGPAARARGRDPEVWLVSGLAAFAMPSESPGLDAPEVG